MKTIILVDIDKTLGLVINELGGEKYLEQYNGQIYLDGDNEVYVLTANDTDLLKFKMHVSARKYFDNPTDESLEEYTKAGVEYFKAIKLFEKA
jgi:hypothetical protein